MTLLETIKKAAAGAGDAADSAVTRYTVVLKGDSAVRDLISEDGDFSGGHLIKRVDGWKVPEAGVANDRRLNILTKKLRRSLKNKKSLDREEFLDVLRSVPEKKLGDIVGGDLVGALVDCCLALGLWEILESFIYNGFISCVNTNNLVEKLLEKNRADLLCLYANQVSGIRVSDLYLILKYFLSRPRGSRESMVKLREQLRKQANLALEKATEKGLPAEATVLAREASILLMMAHDGFSPSELCLHSLFSSPNLDDLVFTSAIAKLGSSELAKLVNYLRKWLEKYERYPEICPCPGAGETLGLNYCQLVPSIESVARGLAMVIDEHYSYLVLNSQFHDEMNSIRRIVESLVSSAGLCSSVANAIENLQQTL